MTRPQHKTVLACSGKLGQEILERLINSSTLLAVLTDKKSESIIDLCRLNGLPCFVGNPRKTTPLETILLSGSELLLSVNYLFLLPQDFFSRFRLSLNIHGSLLPRYRGRTPHVWAIINGERQCGVTVHEIVDECDAGDILFQEEVIIEDSDTGASILERYRAIYYKMIERIMRADLDALRELKRAQQHEKATYFGPRTSESGLIDWGWQWERIRNWVRAQTSPYPGAFTYLDGTRVAILWCELSDIGFQQSMPNGLIVGTSARGFFVKTPNGVLLVTKWSLEDQKADSIVEGKIFNE